MTRPQQSPCTHQLGRRQALALLAAFGVTPEVLAQDAVATDPRSYHVLLENERIRVLAYTSRPGLGVCGQGMHSHPAHVSVLLTGGKVKLISQPGAKPVFDDVPSGHVLYAEAETHSAEVVGGSGMRVIMIELKGKDWKPSTG